MKAQTVTAAAPGKTFCTIHYHAGRLEYVDLQARHARTGNTRDSQPSVSCLLSLLLVTEKAAGSLPQISKPGRNSRQDKTELLVRWPLLPVAHGPASFANPLRLCVPSGGLSVSCAGPGAQGFYQSDTHTGPTSVSPLAYLINGVAHAHPSQQQQQCHGAKPVLLNVGEANKPYPWVPRVTEVALLRLGNFVSITLGMMEILSVGSTRVCSLTDLFGQKHDNVYTEVNSTLCIQQMTVVGSTRA